MLGGSDCKDCTRIAGIKHESPIWTWPASMQTSESFDRPGGSSAFAQESFHRCHCCLDRMGLCDYISGPGGVYGN